MIGQCPACGLDAGDHTIETFSDHTIAYFADPDRTPSEMLYWVAGVMAGFDLALTAGVPAESVAESAHRIADLCHQTIARRHRIGV